MNCEALAEIILDMARGAAMPEAARLSVRRHMETCPSCAAEYARQRDLTTALQALAAEAQEWKAPAATEQRLLAAFAERLGPAAVAARQENDVPVGARVATSRWRYALATAALLTLAVWGIREAGQPGNRRTDEVPGKAGGSEATEDRAAAAAQARTPPAVSEHIDHASRTAPAVSERVDHASRTANARRANPRPANPRAASPVEFMRIPSAIGLPELESGTVLRMELPLAALPEYGLDIAPDAMRTSVEADVLVGQDGQPRAIRLVGISERVAQDSRSRQ
jgi:hypothetical protein